VALFTVLAYTVAFACEWSSAVAATGFPFGLYYYIPATRDRELWIAGVPFMDSLSFTFLSYVSWEVAVSVVMWLRASWRGSRPDNRERVRRSWPTALWASFLMMCLDVIIDPVALRGERWFLGKIYYYPNGGIYFGVTIANFLGWFFVCFAILRLFVWLEKILFKREETSHSAAGVFSYPYKALGPLGLYFGVMGFNLFMTFWIGEVIVGAVGVLIALPLAVLVIIALYHGAGQERRAANA
jgi:putative membrane protein